MLYSNTYLDLKIILKDILVLLSLGFFRTDWIEKCDSGPKETPSLTTSTPMVTKNLKS